MLAAALAIPTQAAVPVQINSGDPAFPFPQFLPYVHANGDTLHNLASRHYVNNDAAKVASAGVTHAEMEKTIRDAYQIMMNRADYAGTTQLGGTRYVKFRSNPDCSEGTGYAMLAAAMMADKATFDGLWLFTHDNAMNNVTRYIDGASSPPYDYSTLPGWKNISGDNSAADGDFDIALALLIAHRQWGEFMGINDSRGNRISYRADVIKVLRGLTDTLSFRQSNNATLITGDIGLDGYFKGGDTWGELTSWASQMANLLTIGITKPPNFGGGGMQHIDYTAPAYFRQFANFLRGENASQYAWNISQFERAEASSDWLIGKHHEQSPRNIPFAGWAEVASNGTVRFTNFSDGEDFRAPWRTILSYVWHGNPDFSWDPARHAVVRNQSNKYLKDAGDRFARFLWDRRSSPWGQTCETIIGEGLWWGPSMLKYYYPPDGGDAMTVFTLNWVQGTGSPSAVTSQDYSLMAEMYRQAELEWDVDETGNGYLTSTPFYFHGFFRLLGLNVLTGNHHAPMNMKRQANMKVYMDVDKTYAFENDTITYTIDYRNYGADTARSVAISNKLHGDFVFISATGGGTYDAATHTVRWNFPAVPGFRTASGINPTRGTLSLKVIIPFANLKRYETKAVVTCSNGPGWESDGYPNKISSVMKRNGVDIARRALRVEKTVYRDTINPGMNAVYTIDFENSAEAGWMNGGRPGVNFSYGHKGTAAQATDHTFMIRGFNDAHEAYIDYGNYRVSYFMFDNSITSLGGNGWLAPADIVIPTSLTAGVKDGLRHEMITPGQDSKGRWNQRLILQLANPESPARTDTNWATMAAPTQFLLNYYGMGSEDGTGGRRIHRGVDSPLKIVWRMHTGSYSNRAWGNDWSFDSRPVVNTATDNMANWGFPISPDFTESYDPDYQGRAVATRHRKLCEAASAITVNNILIEEWDGYTWRRVFGNGPLPGREVNNVIIVDTIPAGVTYQRFLEPLPFGITPTISADGRVITWKIPKLLVGEKGSIKYTVRADALPQSVTTMRITSRAWAIADRESPFSSTAVLVVTTDSLPPPQPESLNMSKRADKEEQYRAGDTISYTITYKQTDGYPVKSTSPSQWTGTGTNRVNSTGDVITLNGPTNMYHSLTYGTNGVLTGSAKPQRYQASVFIFGRSDPNNANRRIELEFDAQWDGLYVTLTANGQTPVKVPSPFGVNDDDSFDYKLVFQNDSLLMWIGDITAPIPAHVFTGIPIQAGYAGVRFTMAEGQANGWLRNWASHFDLAYNVTIRDTVPWGVRYIQGSAAGQLHTTPPRQLTGAVSGGTISWPVVSGTAPANALAANDSLTVTWRGVVDTARNGRIINTVYADLAGYPRDSVGNHVISRFTSAPIIVVPPDDPPDDPQDSTLLTGLTVRANPEDCLFAESVTVRLSALLNGAASQGASIWYNTAGSPDSTSLGARRYTGEPLVFTTHTTLWVTAYLPGYRRAEVATYVYEPLRSVGVASAIFFDDAGNGLAQGVKLVLSATRLIEPNEAAIKRHFSQLIRLPGMPSVNPDSVQFAGDTIVIRFSGGRGVNPASDDYKIIISSPPLPDANYTAEHGYLAAREISIIDGVAPVIIEAVYYPTLSDSISGVMGDTLGITFNKYAVVALDSTITPFVFTYGGVPYVLWLKYASRDGGNTIYFTIIDITGRIPPVPAVGDSVRIKPSGEVRNNFGYGQTNVNNTAVALKVKFPGLKYVIKAGPSPSRDNVRIWITVEPFLETAFDVLDPKVQIFDILGRTVAMTGKNLAVEKYAGEYRLTWDGCNMKGRLVGTGTYLIQVVVRDLEGERRAVRQRVYIIRDKKK
ncbi:MAG: glycosyl hydrolase family 8 [Chitinispirillia bacterium]|nr:glycosyl hydrolase family 8 [Chitinispirillia bacterium]